MRGTVLYAVSKPVTTEESVGTFTPPEKDGEWKLAMEKPSQPLSCS